MTAVTAVQRYRFLCPRCRSALTPWLRELTLPEAVCTQYNDTSLLPNGFFARRGSEVFGGPTWVSFESFPWLLAPLDARWLPTHPSVERTIGCCGLSYRGEGSPNLVCPCGHEVGIGYRDCCGPHWYALQAGVERQSERDPSPLVDPASKLARARVLVAEAGAPFGLAPFADQKLDVCHDEPSRWLDALWLEAPSLACVGGEATPTVIVRAKGLPPGRAIFLPLPWPQLVRLLCLDEAPFGSTEVPLGWRVDPGPTVNISRHDDLVLLTSNRNEPVESIALVFDAAEWSGAWAQLRFGA